MLNKGREQAGFVRSMCPPVIPIMHLSSMWTVLVYHVKHSSLVWALHPAESCIECLEKKNFVDIMQIYGQGKWTTRPHWDDVFCTYTLCTIFFFFLWCLKGVYTCGVYTTSTFVVWEITQKSMVMNCGEYTIYKYIFFEGAESHHFCVS